MTPTRGTGRATALQAVLLDMDGLLVDSEPLWFHAEADAFARLDAGREWTHEDARRLVGQQIIRSAQIIAEAAGSAEPAEHVRDWMVDAIVGSLRKEVPFKPGAAELLTRLRDAGVPAALVSSSYRRLLDPVLLAVPEQSIAVSVAGDEVMRGKPDPEPYLRACQLLGVDPSGCVVLEDSPTGSQAGVAAGCVVVQVPDLVARPASAPWVERASLVDLGVAELKDLVRAHRQGS